MREWSFWVLSRSIKIYMAMIPFFLAPPSADSGAYLRVRLTAVAIFQQCTNKSSIFFCADCLRSICNSRGEVLHVWARDSNFRWGARQASPYVTSTHSEEFSKSTWCNSRSPRKHNGRGADSNPWCSDCKANALPLRQRGRLQKVKCTWRKWVLSILGDYGKKDCGNM